MGMCEVTSLETCGETIFIRQSDLYGDYNCALTMECEYCILMYLLIIQSTHSKNNPLRTNISSLFINKIASFTQKLKMDALLS